MEWAFLVEAEMRKVRLTDEIITNLYDRDYFSETLAERKRRGFIQVAFEQISKTFTKKQEEVWRLWKDGKKPVEIAKELNISRQTTHNRLQLIQKKVKKTLPRYFIQSSNGQIYDAPIRVSRAVRDAILARDDHKCQKCGCKEGLCVHHIRSWKETQDNALSNLLTLCSKCHSAIHKGEPLYNLWDMCSQYMQSLMFQSEDKKYQVPIVPPSERKMRLSRECREILGKQQAEENKFRHKHKTELWDLRQEEWYRDLNRLIGQQKKINNNFF